MSKRNTDVRNATQCTLGGESTAENPSGEPCDSRGEEHPPRFASREVDKQRVPASPARRRFLLRSALVTAGAAATVLPETGRAQQPLGDTPSGGCANSAAPMKDVEGKVAFITGGSSGIGHGIARAFFEAGMKVVLGYRTQEHLDQALEHFKGDLKRVHAIKVDVTDRAAMARAAAETLKVFGQVHVLVNNAGVVHLQSTENTTFDDWDWIMSVNVDGVFNGIRAFLPSIRSHNEGGQVITTASAAGLVAGYSNVLSAYCASKYAVVGLMESLRAELRGSNIGVSVFCPGSVRTNVTASARNRPATLRDTAPRASLPAIPNKKPDTSKPAALVMDPFAVGKLVLDGMRRNDLYILSHAEYMPVIKARAEAMLASAPLSSTAADPVVNDSLYVDEAARRRCRI